MPQLQQSTPMGDIQGTYQPEFARVAEVFADNFAQHGEVGAAVSITIEGASVVDLWGGTRDQRSNDPWAEDTVCVVFSSTKGAVALAAHTLISAGELDVHAPVRKYWPEFAVNGKEQATVKMMLDHSVGVPCMREPLAKGGCCDWEYMIGKLEQERPFWKPGTRNGYHMMNFGWTVGELIRRVSGQSLGAYFNEAIAAPTEAECWIGLPAEYADRVAPIIPFRPVKGAPQSDFTKALINEPKSIQSLALFNNGGFNPNSATCQAAEIGGGGAVANARGLARIYAPFACGGELDGRTFVRPEALVAMGEVAVATHEDATLLLPTRFSLGFMKSMDNRQAPGVAKDSAILSSAAFGHVGAGGSIGFADPASRMSFGYVMNKQGPGILMNERGQGLVDAAYQSLGFTTNAPGVWC
ncbi:MAG: serine hydrolase domain-containing protein [Pseudomonadota bacterium]